MAVLGVLKLNLCHLPGAKHFTEHLVFAPMSLDLSNW